MQNNSENRRKAMTNRRASVSSIRAQFKQNVLGRLKARRSQSVDAVRRIWEEYDEHVKFQTLEGLREQLLEDPQVKELLKTDDITHDLDEVQKELKAMELAKEGDKHLQEVENEIEDLVGHCSVCKQISEQSVCDNCKRQLAEELLT